jgi:serine/threonine-protein kinase
MHAQQLTRKVPRRLNPCATCSLEKLGLAHSAIATVYDFGFHDDKPFTVFEYIEGETLRALLRRRGRLPLDEVRLIVGPLAQALDFAHSCGIVHRDLKPENLRATKHGSFKILDLGLAQEFRRPADWRFMGTPAYAAPEQAAGLASDGGTDQYALALVAYEMLTGRRLFEHRDPRVLLEMHCREEPRPANQVVPDIPESVSAALLKALQNASIHSNRQIRGWGTRRKERSL